MSFLPPALRMLSQKRPLSTKFQLKTWVVVPLLPFEFILNRPVKSAARGKSMTKTPPFVHKNTLIVMADSRIPY